MTDVKEKVNTALERLYKDSDMGYTKWEIFCRRYKTRDTLTIARMLKTRYEEVKDLPLSTIKAEISKNFQNY